MPLGEAAQPPPIPAGAAIGRAPDHRIRSLVIMAVVVARMASRF
jgi:hypothetical protein